LSKAARPSVSGARSGPVREASRRCVAGSHRWPRAVLPTRRLSEAAVNPDSGDDMPVPDPDAEGMAVLEWQMEPGGCCGLRPSHAARSARQCQSGAAAGVFAAAGGRGCAGGGPTGADLAARSGARVGSRKAAAGGLVSGSAPRSAVSATGAGSRRASSPPRTGARPAAGSAARPGLRAVPGSGRLGWVRGGGRSACSGSVTPCWRFLRMRGAADPSTGGVGGEGHRQTSATQARAMVRPWRSAAAPAVAARPGRAAVQPGSIRSTRSANVAVQSLTRARLASKWNCMP